MPATVRASYYGGAAGEPAGVTAETGIKFNREDTQTGTTSPVPIPTATGTNYSWIKLLALEVTGAAATTLSNRKVALASSPTTGLKVHFKYAAAYAQPASGSMPSASGSNGAVPATYTEVTTTPQTYDSASVSGNSTGRNGGFCQLVLGVDYSYAGGGGQATLPNILLSYDEA